MMKIYVLFLFFLLVGCQQISSITVDLRDPSYSNGVLRTEKGGVVNAPKLRIQAKRIEYIKKHTAEEKIERIVAEEDLLVEYGQYVIVGKRIEYDFETHSGVVFEGRTGMDLWFAGGKEIHLRPDGSYLIYHGFATTAENVNPDWAVEVEEATLDRCRYLDAKNMHFRVRKFSLLWVPQFRVNLDSIYNSPFHYTVRFGGAKGPRIGLRYDAFNWRGVAVRFLLDYRLSQGLGGGIELDYKSPSKKERFRAVNYLAKDLTTYNDKRRTRYRYMGVYSNCLDNGRTQVLASYDVLSDKEMATDYADKGLRLESGKRTQIEIRRQVTDWTMNLLGRFRVNRFQTVKQELPTLSGSLRPFVIGDTGIISENRFKFSYLELEFTDDRPHQHDFNSPRYELSTNFYRNFRWGNLNITPEAGFLAIYYGNNPDKFQRWMTIGLFDVDINTNLYRFYKDKKHVITPYVRYSYYTYPETSPNDHFIFDITDGWYRLNLLRLGVENNIYTKTDNGCIYRKFYADFSLFTFFDTETIPETFYKAYSKFVYNVTPFMRNTLEAGWDIQRNMLDHWNYRLQWTLSANAAIACEYRHRSPFAWRKVDYTNFILDSFRSENKLRRSALSDKRDTFLLGFYYKFHPNWALGLESRNGWNRDRQPDYFEYEVSLLGRIRSSWNFKIAYRKREDDARFIFNFSVGLRKPEPINPDCFIPCLEF